MPIVAEEIADADQQVVADMPQSKDCDMFAAAFRTPRRNCVFRLRWRSGISKPTKHCAHDLCLVLSMYYATSSSVY